MFLCAAHKLLYGRGVGLVTLSPPPWLFVPYYRDAERYVMVRGGGIWGARKVKFEGHDFGMITGSVWSAPVSA